MLHKSALACGEHVEGHSSQDVLPCGRTVVQQCFKACSNAVEEAISGPADFQGADLGVKAGVRANERL